MKVRMYSQTVTQRNKIMILCCTDLHLFGVQCRQRLSTFSHYRDMKCVKNPQNGGGLGWLGVTEMSPFDRAHTTSYSTLTETMRLSCTVFKIHCIISLNSPTLPYSTCIWHPRSNFEKIFGIRKLESLDYRVELFACSYV